LKEGVIPSYLTIDVVEDEERELRE